MPVKSLPILERSVNKPAAVAEYMEKTMAERIRAKNWWVWFQIDRRDQELLGKLIQPARPPENMFIPARVRVYKSKKKSKEDAEKKKKKGKKDDEEDDDNDDNAFGSAVVDEENGARSENDDNKAGEGKDEVIDVDSAPLSKDDTTEPTVSESKPDVNMTDAPTVSSEEPHKSTATKLEADVVDFDAMEH
ncbi:hypothetical protein D0Z03_002182 [Geotrichum reessii]|nr:hypothetical protein D0Z03_002182 [Galactomyces reessii]